MDHTKKRKQVAMYVAIQLSYVRTLQVALATICVHSYKHNSLANVQGLIPTLFGL